MTGHLPVLVAVGHDPMDAALTYAIAESRRAGCGVHLLHVVHVVIQGPETMLVETTDVERIGKRTLAAVREQAEDLAGGDVPVSSEVLVGPVVPTLVHAAAGARTVVLQHRSLGRWQRVVTRSVAGGVAARTRIPVVSVPSGWRPDPAHTWVTVGVGDVAGASEVLEAAIGEARSRLTGLRVVHAFDFPAAYDDVALTPVELAQWTDRARSEITQRMAVLPGGADVPVHVVVERASAAEAILRAGADSALVVVGRHDPLLPVGSHLGPVSRAVLRDATCPVLLAHPQPSRRTIGAGTTAT